MSIIKKLRWKDKSGKTTDYDLGAKASNVEQDSTHRFVSDTEKQTWNGKANPGDIPSGSAANYGVANNDTTNRSDQLVTAQVAYQHGKEIDQLISELSRKLLDSYTFDGSTAQSVAHNKFYQTLKSLNLANMDYKRLSIVIEAGENNQNVDNYYCYRKTPNGLAFGYYQYTYVEVITLANVSSVIRWTYASGETTDITDYQPVAGAKYSLFYN